MDGIGIILFDWNYCHILSYHISKSQTSVWQAMYLFIILMYQQYFHTLVASLCKRIYTHKVPLNTVLKDKVHYQYVTAPFSLYLFPISHKNVLAVQLQAINNHWKYVNVTRHWIYRAQQYGCTTIYLFALRRFSSIAEWLQMSQERNHCRAVTWFVFVNCLLAPVISGSLAC